ncbi:MAG: hypothetical protein PHW64_01185 [Sulfuricurvum sp.]|nr:hypothetical protein [Sulfuricurvum sp.]
MKLPALYLIGASLLMLQGCTQHHGVSPNQNQTLNVISPNTTSRAKGGAMQRSLDSWLKEEWLPLSSPSADGSEQNRSSVAKTETPSSEESSFLLQNYVDKWKNYHTNKAVIDSAKPKEPSLNEELNNFPVIGK